MKNIVYVASYFVAFSVFSGCGGFNPDVEALRTKLFTECMAYPTVPLCALNPEHHPDASFAAWEYAMQTQVETAEEEQCLLAVVCEMENGEITPESLDALVECANLSDGPGHIVRDGHCVERCHADHVNCGFEVLPGGEGMCHPDAMAGCVDSITECTQNCPEAL